MQTIFRTIFRINYDRVSAPNLSEPVADTVSFGSRTLPLPASPVKIQLVFNDFSFSIWKIQLISVETQLISVLFKIYTIVMLS